VSDTFPNAEAQIRDSSQGIPHLHYPVEFKGKAGEYFPIWIVNVLLCIITFYIYSPWAKVRTKRYFYGNTFIDNNSFDYLATPIQIFKGRVIAVVALIVATIVSVFLPSAGVVIFALLAIATPWVVWRSLKFNARMTSFRNLRFGFQGKLISIYGVLIVAPAIIIGLLAVLAFYIEMTLSYFSLGFLGSFGFYLIWPWIKRMLMSYTGNGHRYGTSSFAANYKTASVYGIYVLGFLLGVFSIIMVSLLFWAAFSAVMFIVLGDFDAVREQLSNLTGGPGRFSVQGTAAQVFFVLLFLGGLLGYSYFKATLRNYRYGRATLAGKISFQSSVDTWSLYWMLISNYIALIFTLGLFYPWASVRLAKYYARRTHLIVQGSLDEYVAGEVEAVSALGEEIGEAFDVDMDIAI